MADSLKGEARKAAKRLLKARPRIRRMIVVAYWRAVRKLTKEQTPLTA